MTRQTAETDSGPAPLRQGGKTEQSLRGLSAEYSE